MPQGVSVVYNEVSATDCAAISSFPGAIFKTDQYHIRFLNLDKDPTKLERNTYYKVTITAS